MLRTEDGGGSLWLPATSLPEEAWRCGPGLYVDPEGH